MLVSELKNLIKEYGADDLQRLIVELYKAMTATKSSMFLPDKGVKG